MQEGMMVIAGNYAITIYHLRVIVATLKCNGNINC